MTDDPRPMACFHDLNLDQIQTRFLSDNEAEANLMNAIRVAEDIVPIGAFKARASHWLKHAKVTGQPVVITQNGHPAGVLVSPAEYDRMQERERFLADVAAGLADAEAGRTLGLDDVATKLAERRKARGAA